MPKMLFLAVLCTLLAGLAYITVRYDRSIFPAFRQKLDDLLFGVFLALAVFLVGYSFVHHVALILKADLGL